MVFVDGQCADTLYGFTAGAAAAQMLCVEAVVDYIALHAQVVGHGELAAATDLFEAHMQHKR